jgi:hypothetical protein
MLRIVFPVFVLVLSVGCSSSSSGGKKGGTGGTGGSGAGGTGGGLGGGPPGGGGTGSGGAPVQLQPTCSGFSTVSAGTCYGDTPCNPVTNVGCATAGEACDIAESGFQCYPPPNDIAVCGVCGDGAFCAPGNVCVNGQCLHYCCTDGDCGSGKCYDVPLQNVTVPIKACLNAAPPSG